MHDYGKLASHRDARALHAPALGDGDTPSPQARPLAGTGHQRGCSLIEEVPQHSIAALADLSRSVDLARLIHALTRSTRTRAALAAKKARGERLGNPNIGNRILHAVMKGPRHRA